MSMLASYEGLGEFAIVAAVLFVTWASSAVLALIAIALAVNGRTRRRSRRFAIASMVASVPISVFDASLPFRSPGGSFPIADWSFIVLTLVPLIVGIGVLCFDWYFLRKDGEETHAA